MPSICRSMARQDSMRWQTWWTGAIATSSPMPISMKRWKSLIGSNRVAGPRPEFAQGLPLTARSVGFMAHPSHDLLRDALRRLRSGRWGGELNWDLLIRQARHAGLLARLAIALDEMGLLATLPSQPQQHLLAERLVADKLMRDVRWEVSCIKAALRSTGAPIVLLKGAAYALAGLPPAQGRIFQDVDILVPKASLADVEAALRLSGWMPARVDAHDERYYREWMHQIPPMTTPPAVQPSTCTIQSLRQQPGSRSRRTSSLPRQS